MVLFSSRCMLPILLANIIVTEVMPVLSKEDLIKEVIPILKEYLETGDSDEVTVSCLSNFSILYLSAFVYLLPFFLFYLLTFCYDLPSTFEPPSPGLLFISIYLLSTINNHISYFMGNYNKWYLMRKHMFQLEIASCRKYSTKINLYYTSSFFHDLNRI